MWRGARVDVFPHGMSLLLTIVDVHTRTIGRVLWKGNAGGRNYKWNKIGSLENSAVDRRGVCITCGAPVYTNHSTTPTLFCSGGLAKNISLADVLPTYLISFFDMLEHISAKLPFLVVHFLISLNSKPVSKLTEVY